MNNIYRDGNFAVRDSVLEDVIVVRDILRQEDREEVWALGHLNAEKALLIAYVNSQLSHTVLHNGSPIAMFGLIPAGEENPDHGNIWFLGSDELAKTKRSFLKACRIFIAGMLDLYPILFNYVDARYEKSVRWLKWCGAEINPAEPFGIDGQPFHYLTFRRP